MVEGPVQRTLRGTKQCFESAVGSAAWLRDPCCNSALRWQQCCAMRAMEVTMDGMLDVNAEAVNARCREPARAAALLRGYTEREYDSEECENKAREMGADWQVQDSLMQFVRVCNEEIYGSSSTGNAPPCLSDEDCYTSCDKLRGACIIPYDDPDPYLLQCYVENINESVNRTWRRDWGLTGLSSIDEFKEAFRTHLYDAQCVGPTAWMHNARWMVQSVADCTDQFDDTTTTNCWCVGSTSQSLRHLRAIHERNRRHMSPADFERAGNHLLMQVRNGESPQCWVSWLEPANRDACLAEQQCNWDSALDATDCLAAAASSHFCGECHGSVCWDQARSSQAECEQGRCVLDARLTAEECVTRGSCSKPCNKCRARETGRVLCHDASKTAETCDGTWVPAHSTCVYDAQECDGHTFESCESQSVGSCTTGLSAIAQALLRCYVNHWDTCDSEAECTAAGGDCDDWDLQNWHRAACWSDLDSARTDAACLGVCVLPYDTSKGSGGWPFCDVSTGGDSTVAWSRVGCVYYDIPNDESCSAAGGVWHTRAFDREACHAHGSGCRERGVWELSHKSAHECDACEGQVEPFYTWRAGRWVTSTMQPLQWRERAFTSINRWQPTLNHTKLWRAAERATAHVIAQGVRSAMQCEKMRVADVMAILVCDCAAAGGSGCFNNVLETQVGTQIVYAGVATTIKWATAEVHVPAGVISPESDSAVISASTIADLSVVLVLADSGSVRRRNQKQPRDPYAPDAYDVVVNPTTGQIVGRLLGLGVTITLPVNQTLPVQLCLFLDGGIPLQSSAYPVPDFATPTGVNATWRPLNLVITIVGNDVQYCADISQSGAYYPARRVANWENFTTTPPAATADPTLGADAVVGIALGSVFGLLLILLVLMQVLNRSGGGGSYRTMNAHIGDDASGYQMRRPTGIRHRTAQSRVV